MSSSSSSDDEEYIVGKIVRRMKFEKLVQKTLEGNALFHPDTIRARKGSHSKYAYLVHWEGYQVKDRTWEPEHMLLKNIKLKEFKKSIGAPSDHLTIDRVFETGTWDRLQAARARVAGYDYLMTDEELEAANAKKTDKQKRLEELNAKQVKKDNPTRPRMVTPDDAEAIAKRKKKSEKMSSLPGLKALDENTPRIQKKPSDAIPTISPESPVITSYSQIPSPSTHSEKSVFDTNASVGASSSSSYVSNQSMKNKRSSDGDKKKPKIKKTTSSDSVIVIDDEKEDELALQKRIKKAKRELEDVNTKLSKYPVEVVVERSGRNPFTVAAQCRQFRRCKSLENLCEFYKNASNMETFSKNYTLASFLKEDEIPVVKRVLKKEPFLNEGRMKAMENSVAAKQERLVKENTQNLKKAKKNMKYDQNFFELLKHLSDAFSKDDNFRFKTIFRKGFPSGENYDAHRYAAIVFIISYCDHCQWTADPEGKKMVESDGMNKWGNIRKQEIECSPNHRKCIWMDLFMELIPDKFRFLETSGRSLNGSGDDGPFRDSVYFHCMRSGAECQKRLFFKHSKPIGIQEEECDGYSLDAMHFLAVQYGNLQRIPSYLSFGGLDINAVATHVKTKRVRRLQEYLNEWSQKNLSQMSDAHKKYYKELVHMVRLTSESLQNRIEAEFNSVLTARMNLRFALYMMLTYPHILRCSPENNESRSGEGNQVLSCLFHPQGPAFKDGLETKVDDKSLFEESQKYLEKFRKIVDAGRGRLFVALYRTDIRFSANPDRNFALPEFNIVRDDEGFKVEKMTLLRQVETDDPDLVDIGLMEMTPFASPGCRYFVVPTLKQEKTLIVPGSAHIEIRGEFDKPMTFITQVFLLKAN